MNMKALGRAATALLLAAAFATAGAGQQAQPTIQEQFDAASAALEAENWAEALRILEALETRVARAGNARSLAVVRVRKAQALFRLDRHDEARTLLRTSLPLLPADNPSLHEDRFRSHVGLGRLAELRLDYREAAAEYRQAAAIAVDPALKLAVYRGLVQTLMFYDAPAALAAADEALRLLAAVAPNTRELEGQFRTSRGRVLLNMGRFEEAREELERATRRLGGLGLQVDLRDLIARSDLAIAALRAGNEEAARRYLALTGAGRMREATLPAGGYMPLPRCGDGLSPSDVAVVELAIRDDGTVAYATPVYASARGDSAVRFARAALAWNWPAEQVRTIEPLFRSAARVELRCSLAPRQPNEFRPHEVTQIERWAAERGIGVELVPARKVPLQQMRADLAAAEAQHGVASPHLLRPLMRLAASEELPARERVELLRRALPIALAARVPGPYVTMIAMWLAQQQHQAAGAGGDSGPDYLALLADPRLAGDPHVAASLHLALAGHLFAAGRMDEAAAMLERARAIPGFGPDHSLWPEVVDLIVAVQMARGDADAAAAAYRSLPADTFPCAIPPQHRRGRGTSEDFPNQALIWGFEGWTVNEAQVDAEGRPVSVRTVLAYPAFVFGPASEQMIGRFRFAPAFTPETGPCATFSRRIIYRLPDR